MIYGQKIDSEHLKYLDIVVDKLQKENIDIYFYGKFLDFLKNEFDFEKDFKEVSKSEEISQNKIELLLSIGGDGTILHSAILVKDTKTPILGINLGRLGFLAIVEKNKIIDAIDDILAKEYKIEKRTLIELNSEPRIFGDNNIALNDFTVHKSSSSSVITVHTYLNDNFLGSYWVDGLIVSTPTGSTGYSLSCGGPIIFPGSGNFVITPVAPHNLTMRPIVVPDSSVISFDIESRSDKVLCTLDSRYETITTKYKLSIKKSKYSINLMVLKGHGFSKSIQNKLNWGKDKRN